MKISIVIPNYNGAHLLKKNLPSVFEAAEQCQKNNGSLVEVIIVDDCSTDDSLHEIQNYLAEPDPASQDNLKLKIIKNEKNMGFSSAVNKGVREAGGEIVVLLNTDVRPEKNFLEPLLKHFSDPDVFSVGCMDKSIENGKTILRGRGVGIWKRGFLVHSRGEVDKTDTLWVSGGSGAFRKKLWEKLSGLNELYNPFYWEDIDLSYRALKSGYKIIFEPKSVIIHEHERGTIKSKYSSFKIKTIAYRNQFIFVWQNVTDLKLRLLHIFWLPYHLLKALLRLDLAFFLGFLEALIKLPKIIQIRFTMGKSFIKKDNDVMKIFLK